MDVQKSGGDWATCGCISGAEGHFSGFSITVTSKKSTWRERLQSLWR
jgi:hypothetical protein